MKMCIIRSEMKAKYGQIHGHCSDLNSKCIGFVRRFSTFAAYDKGTIVLPWHDQ